MLLLISLSHSSKRKQKPLSIFVEAYFNNYCQRQNIWLDIFFGLSVGFNWEKMLFLNWKFVINASDVVCSVNLIYIRSKKSSFYNKRQPFKNNLRLFLKQKFNSAFRSIYSFFVSLFMLLYYIYSRALHSIYFYSVCCVAIIIVLQSWTIEQYK